MVKPLLSARLANGGDTLTVLDGTAGGAAGLNGLDDGDRLGVRDLAEDDVAAVEQEVTTVVMKNCEPLLRFDFCQC